LAPGEEVKVRASVDISRFRGVINKPIRAYAPGNFLLATMEITATIQGPVNFSIREADFGTVHYGAAASIPLTVTLGASVPDSTILPKLTSSNPNVLLTPVETAAGGATAAKNERLYTIAISPKAPIGPLNGLISFEVAESASDSARMPATVPGTKINVRKTDDKSAAAIDPALIPSLRSVSVLIAGEVMGKIAANPTMIVFGNAMVTTRQVTLSSESATAFKDLKISSPSQWITARILPASTETQPTTTSEGKSKQDGQATTTLEVTLSPQAPPGTLETQLHVVTADGEDLSLPIMAQVQPKG
jgi:hypothetical protein